MKRLVAKLLRRTADRLDPPITWSVLLESKGRWHFDGLYVQQHWPKVTYSSGDHCPPRDH